VSKRSRSSRFASGGGAGACGAHDDAYPRPGRARPGHFL